MPNKVTSVMTTPNVPETCAINLRVSLVLFCSSRVWYSLSTGTKACAKAPSAKSRRKKFGILLAKKNTSADAPAPIKLAITTSRTKPRIRDIKVMTLTIMPDLINFLLKQFNPIS